MIIYTDSEQRGYVTDDVSSIHVFEANTNEDNRVKWVTDLAAVSRGKDESANPPKRYQALMKEAAPNYCKNGCEGKPSRPFEFLPVAIKIGMDGSMYKFEEPNDSFYKLSQHELLANVIPFGTCIGKPENGLYKFYTNMRALVSAGIPYELIPYNDPEIIKNGKFFAIKLNTPMFSWAQLVTHTQISTESRSGRVVDEEEYWFPDDIEDRIVEAHNKNKVKIIDKSTLENTLLENYSDMKDKFNNQISIKDLQAMRDDLYDSLIKDDNALYIPADLFGPPSFNINFGKFLNMYYTPLKIQKLFKELGYKREIYGRALYYMKYKLFVMTAWGINDKAWNHFFLERNATDQWKNWTQPETAEIVKKIKELYDAQFA